MYAYCKEIRKLEDKFYGIKYTHVIQDKNQAADELSKLGHPELKFHMACSSKTLLNHPLRKKQIRWSRSL
jgi:lantibiotic modifying enzyme